MRARRLFVFVLGPGLVSACALIADLGDRTLGAVDGSTGATVDGSTTTDGSVLEDGATPPDNPDATPSLPSYCNGLVLYAAFDTKLTGDVGGESTLSLGGVTQSQQGKFGGALSLVRDAGKPDAGAAHYFLATDAGNPWPADVGSISLWYRAVPGGAPSPVLYRPVASLPPAPLRTAGLTFVLDFSGRSGLYGPGSDTIFTFPIARLTPFLRNGEYNQFFAAWQRPDGGTNPSAYIALNGGLGVEYSDAGLTYPDAADDAGELDVPYRGFTRVPWTSEGPPVGLRLGGPGGNAPDGTIDDLAVWNRILSFEEVAALYNASQSLGTACKR